MGQSLEHPSIGSFFHERLADEEEGARRRRPAQLRPLRPAAPTTHPWPLPSRPSPSEDLQAAHRPGAWAGSVDPGPVELPAHPRSEVEARRQARPELDGRGKEAPAGEEAPGGGAEKIRSSTGEAAVRRGTEEARGGGGASGRRGGEGARGRGGSGAAASGRGKGGGAGLHQGEGRRRAGRQQGEGRRRRCRAPEGEPR
ncbi:hypothetical protein PR202_gb10056 [Eleusine coracana subsp. coracana]|uniref:Uncharacterized protein n=1 Tax=Eleusine coracana subsp. coracana TaxID=191504 RepID=A0AAV5EIZ3_ELECO|nr:hypothetical protein PR202_gb10056 [Eleusine coracana subsp. coracana]